MMRAERGYFLLCLALGRLLRAARYSEVRIVDHQVRKRRVFFAPLLIRLSDPLIRLLDAGVRILPQRDWEARERRMYQSLYGTAIGTDAGGTLVLPWLSGKTLASVLADQELEEPAREKAIERAVVALAAFHRRGFTHGDAMAENVMVDIEAGTARWFDFETIHESSRPMAWRRADDVRALVVTCLIRTAPDRHAEALGRMLDLYADEEITELLAVNFSSVLRRPLTFHLAQAGLSFPRYREIARLLNERAGH